MGISAARAKLHVRINRRDLREWRPRARVDEKIKRKQQDLYRDASKRSNSSRRTKGVSNKRPHLKSMSFDMSARRTDNVAQSCYIFKRLYGPRDNRERVIVGGPKLNGEKLLYVSAAREASRAKSTVIEWENSRESLAIRTMERASRSRLERHDKSRRRFSREGHFSRELCEFERGRKRFGEISHLIITTKGMCIHINGWKRDESSVIK